MKPSPTWQFFRRFLSSPDTVGACLPSSNHLAKAMASQIAPYSNQKRYILEVGAGTGAFTDAILQKLSPQDELHLVELDPELASILKEKYSPYPNIKIFNVSIFDFNPPNNIHYDYIICGIPLHALGADRVEKLFNKFYSLSKKPGVMTYVEYMLLPSLKPLILNKSDRKNLEKIFELKKDFYRKYPLKKERVWLNFLPAQVTHHQFK